MYVSRERLRPAHRASATALFVALPLGLLLVLAAPARAQHENVAKFTASFSQAKAAPGETVELRVEYAIESGWYIYAPNHKATGVPTSVDVADSALEPAGDLRFPEPVVERVEILDETHHKLVGKGTLSRSFTVRPGAAPGARTVELTVRHMTCNDQICVPRDPLKLAAALEIVAAAAPDGAAVETKEPEAGTIGLGKFDGGGLDLGGLDGGGKIEDAGKLEGGKFEDGGLSGIPGLEGAAKGKARAPHTTWTFELGATSLRRGTTTTLTARFDIEKDWYIYAPDHADVQRTTLALDSSPLELTGDAEAPGTIDKEDFGIKSRVVKGRGEMRFEVRARADTEPGPHEFTVSARSNPCNDPKQICDPTETSEAVTLRVEITDEPPLEVVVAPAEGDQDGEAPRGDDLGLMAFLLQAVFWGFVTLLMPCTYPMIPITIAYFTKQADSRHGNVLPLALTYGAGIVAFFVAVGVAVGPWIVKFATWGSTNLVFGLLFLVFALSLFGLFEIRVPSALLGVSGRAARIGGYLGVFVLGATLVITSFTCTAPFVGSLLASGAGHSLGEIALGMGVFGLTMATPFVGLGMFPTAAKKMPRSGAWMQTLKVTLGFLEVAAAFKFFSNVDLAWNLQSLPRELFFLLWAAIALITGLYLLGFFGIKEERPAAISPLRMVAALGIVLFAAYCLHGANGNRLDRIMMAIAPPYSGGGHGARSAGEAEDRVIVEDDFDGGIARAKEERKLAFVNWTGRLCNNCRLMEEGVFQRDDVRALLAEFVEVRAHTDVEEDWSRELAERKAERLDGNTASPYYEIVDPLTLEALARFEGADLTGTRFLEFLRKGLAKSPF